MRISKTELLRLATCKNWFWLSIREPESLSGNEGGEALVSEGIRFEEFARKKFPQGVLLKSFGEPAVAKTKELFSAGKACLFQATASHDDFLVKADVLERNEDGTFNLYEIKASTNIHDEYLLDTAIQRVVFNDAGFSIAKCFLVLLNNDYVRGGDLVVDEVLTVLNVTAQVRAMEAIEVRPLMAEAKRIVGLDDIPVSNIAELECTPNGAIRCGCADVSYKELADYSVFDISRLSRADSSKLLNKGIVLIDDMKPRSIKLTRSQAIQVALTQKKMRKVDDERLEAELKQLQYPIYFLDYETFNFALPRLEGFAPYQQYVFQYSLHVLESKDAELEHFEFLSDSNSLESLNALAASMRATIKSDNGSVVVWHRQFEETRNAEMGKLFPEFHSFFQDINRRVYDLEEVFKQGIFLDYRFKGRTSIKAILPVLCPQFSYKELVVQNGGDAMNAWYEMITSELDDTERQNRIENLLAYCKLDTLAMVEILNALQQKSS